MQPKVGPRPRQFRGNPRLWCGVVRCGAQEASPRLGWTWAAGAGGQGRAGHSSLLSDSKSNGARASQSIPHFPSSSPPLRPSPCVSFHLINHPWRLPPPPLAEAAEPPPTTPPCPPPFPTRPGAAPLPPPTSPPQAGTGIGAPSSSTAAVTAAPTLPSSSKPPPPPPPPRGPDPEALTSRSSSDAGTLIFFYHSNIHCFLITVINTYLCMHLLY